MPDVRGRVMGKERHGTGSCRTQLLPEELSVRGMSWELGVGKEDSLMFRDTSMTQPGPGNALYLNLKLHRQDMDFKTLT